MLILQCTILFPIKIGKFFIKNFFFSVYSLRINLIVGNFLVVSRDAC